MLARTGVWNNSSVACGFSSNKIDYSDYPKSLISKIKYRDILLKKPKLHLSSSFCCNHTCYCINMVSVTSASHYIMTASRYHPIYQSRSSMYISGLIPRNFAELAEAVPIASTRQTQSIIQLSFPYQDDCKLIKGHKALHNKTRNKHRTRTMKVTINIEGNQQKQNHRPRTYSSPSHWGLKCILPVQNLPPRFSCC